MSTLPVDLVDIHSHVGRYWTKRSGQLLGCFFKRFLTCFQVRTKYELLQKLGKDLKLLCISILD